jgi:hypothetical protein
LCGNLRVLLSDDSAKVCRLALFTIRTHSGPPSDTKFAGGFFVKDCQKK